jgi:hypothetical protein
MALDVARQRVVLLAGSAGTWEWDGALWTASTPATYPSGARGNSMVFDPTRGRCLLASPPETWEWDGSSWARLQPPVSPPLRDRHALACDEARGRIVLFGGWEYGNYLADTWEWDGSTWTERRPATSPPPRAGHAMAYDPLRARTVLFGGARGQYSYLADTWEWDGTDWTRIAAVGPSRRARHAMTFDASRGRVVLDGGIEEFQSSWPTLFPDTWEWDGASWAQQTATPRPPARAGHAMCRDASRSSSLLFGGTTEDAAPDETWRYGAPQAASAASFGAGCPGTPGVPVLTGNPPYTGCAAVSLELLAVQPGAACVFGISLRTASQPLGGCTCYLTDPLWAWFAVSNSAGAARVVLPGPASLPLHGVTLFAQGIVLDQGGPIPRLALSAGLRLVFGD